MVFSEGGGCSPAFDLAQVGGLHPNPRRQLANREFRILGPEALTNLT